MQVDEIDFGLVAKVAMNSVSDVDNACVAIVASTTEADSLVSMVDAPYSAHSYPIHPDQCRENMREVSEILD